MNCCWGEEASQLLHGAVTGVEEGTGSSREVGRIPTPLAQVLEQKARVP